MTIAADRTTWTRVCRTDQLIPERGVAALVGSEPVAVFLLDDGSVRAVGHRDPFSSANVMARGIVGSRGDRPTIASPLHKEVYDLGTGECFTDGSLALRTYRTRIVGGMIEVELDG